MKISKMNKNQVVREIASFEAALANLQYEQQYQEGYYKGDVPQEIVTSYCYSEKLFLEKLDELHARLGQIEENEQKDANSDYEHFRNEI